MAKRSPILGYNHNVRHRGLLFHVQTEDSGVDNPHIFTHLFHSGVIISTRKLQYDRESAEEVVKALMQAQHKAALRELKSGVLDEKITSYLGDRPELEAAPPRSRQVRDTLDSIETIPPQDVESWQSDTPVDDRPPELSQTARSGDVSNAFRLIKRESTAPVIPRSVPPDLPPAPPGPRRRPSSQTGYSLHRTGQTERVPEVHDEPSGPTARGKGRPPPPPTPMAPRPPAGAVRPAGKPHAPPAPPLRPAGKSGSRPPVPARPGGTVVSRPAVMVGAPASSQLGNPRERGPDPASPRAIRRAREDTRPSLFGKDLISERSLDEVILAYLSEDASDK